MLRKTLLATLGLSALLLSSCKTPPTDPINDPYETVNRPIYQFNSAVDVVFIRPFAVMYQKITPNRVQRGVNNAFSNIGEINNMANNLLQLKFTNARDNLARFAINSTVGIGGLMDRASDWGIEKNSQDFGLTLAYWSNGSRSPYLVLPIFGPGTFRSAFARPFDMVMSPLGYIDKDKGLEYGLLGGRIVSARSRFLAADRMIADSFDPYVFVRDAYLQRRNAKVSQNSNGADVNAYHGA